MGKVELIKKSRKENKCRKCGSIIAVGSSYYRGKLNFSPDIVRCTKCGLEGWEVTTSDYQLNVGEIVYKWRENYGTGEEVAEEIKGALEEIRDELQDKLDNMPEQLQYAPTGETLQERIDALDSCMDELDSIDIEDIKSDVVSECEALDDMDDESEDGEEPDYDTIMEDESFDADIKAELVSELESKLAEAIDEALSGLDV